MCGAAASARQLVRFPLNSALSRPSLAAPVALATRHRACRPIFPPKRRLHRFSTDATAYCVELGYQFPNAARQPALSCRYSYFSGNRNRPDQPLGTKHSYDPLFYGGGFRDYLGNWGLGEIVGTYMQLNSNLIVHQAELRLTAPFHLVSREDLLQFELLAYQFLFDKTQPVGVTSRRFAREVDVSARYIRDERTSGAVTFGGAFPQKGGREWFDGQTAIDPDARRAGRISYLAEFYVIRSF